LVREINDLDEGSTVVGNHHYQFFVLLPNLLAEALYDFNGGQGAISDYLYQAHKILNTQQLADAMNGLILDPITGQPKIPPFYNLLSDQEKSAIQSFNLTNFKDGWDSIGGDDAFNLNCN